eukprot:1178563-Prorocentrum_minimum.AAC.3
MDDKSYTPPLLRLVLTLGIYCLPSCDWFSRWGYTASPLAIGSHAGDIRLPLLRLVLRGKYSSLKVHCLVRAGSAKEAHARVEGAVKAAGARLVFTLGRWCEGFERHIVAHVGDLRQSQLGLNRDTFEQLCADVDAVFHLAASVKLLGSYADLRNELEDVST